LARIVAPVSAAFSAAVTSASNVMSSSIEASRHTIDVIRNSGTTTTGTLPFTSASTAPPDTASPDTIAALSAPPQDLTFQSPSAPTPVPVPANGETDSTSAVNSSSAVSAPTPGIASISTPARLRGTNGNGNGESPSPPSMSMSVMGAATPAP
jgi:hypothetical protein